MCSHFLSLCKCTHHDFSQGHRESLQVRQTFPHRHVWTCIRKPGNVPIQTHPHLWTHLKKTMVIHSDTNFFFFFNKTDRVHLWKIMLLPPSIWQTRTWAIAWVLRKSIKQNKAPSCFPTKCSNNILISIFKVWPYLHTVIQGQNMVLLHSYSSLIL